jgi:glycosyltransferase involved in cell wall biosynthesis
MNQEEKKLKIAMIGQKGIPARYGGIETHVEAMATRLARRGHDVWVYCRNRFRPDDPRAFDEYEVTGPRTASYRDVNLAFRPSIHTKHLDASSHSFICSVEAALDTTFDIVHFHAIGPSAFVPIVRAAGRTVVSTVHALDWRQAKWGAFARYCLRRGEANAVHRSHGVIAVSEVITAYIRDRYGVEARHIPNGASVVGAIEPSRVAAYGIDGDDYILTVGRIIPDRGLHTLIDAFKKVPGNTRLVIVGSETPRTRYTDRLKSIADDRVIFTGDLYDGALAELYANCKFYVLASEVEGLPITVCEAMGYGKAALLSDIPENKEVGGEAAMFFRVNDRDDLTRGLKELLEDDAARLARGREGRQRVAGRFNWNHLAEETERYYFEVLERLGRL